MFDFAISLQISQCCHVPRPILFLFYYIRVFNVIITSLNKSTKCCYSSTSSHFLTIRCPVIFTLCTGTPCHDHLLASSQSVLVSAWRDSGEHLSMTNIPNGYFNSLSNTTRVPFPSLSPPHTYQDPLDSAPSPSQTLESLLPVHCLDLCPLS